MAETLAAARSLMTGMHRAAAESRSACQITRIRLAPQISKTADLKEHAVQRELGTKHGTGGIAAAAGKRRIFLKRPTPRYHGDANEYISRVQCR